jgi:hypothetical protein
MRQIRPLTVLALLTVTAAAAHPAPGSAQATEGDYLYKVSMLRAAPGMWVELMDILEAADAVHAQAGDAAPFLMRHSQGDQWDFMLLYPMGDHGEYHAADRKALRARAWSSPESRDLAMRWEAATAYHEEWFARSVPLDEMRRRFDGMGFFHIEMFAGLPGKRRELLEQRRMENRYYRHLDRQLNLLFVRDSGPNWDAMTLGFYPDLQAYAAAGARYSEAEQEEAAQAAGFDGVNTISPYLRSLLSYHHDTLAVRVR